MDGKFHLKNLHLLLDFGGKEELWHDEKRLMSMFLIESWAILGVSPKRI